MTDLYPREQEGGRRGHSLLSAGSGGHFCAIERTTGTILFPREGSSYVFYSIGKRGPAPAPSPPQTSSGAPEGRKNDRLLLLSRKGEGE